eukprot:886008-Ditylum_brightwellii.AAC.1
MGKARLSQKRTKKHRSSPKKKKGERTHTSLFLDMIPDALNGGKVTIGTVTLAEIKKAAKIYSGESGHLPESQKQRQLVRVPSKGQRIRFLKEAADAIAAKEALALPSHGGRPWKCEVK